MYKLVILDDEEQVAGGIAKIFPWHNVGFEVESIFTDPHQALRYVQSHPVDVLMTDIRMPGLSGIEVVKQLTAQNTGIKIVFMSGYSDFEYMKSAIVHSVFDYLLKPLNYDELLNCFTRLRDMLEQENGVEETEATQSYYAQIVDTVLKYIKDNIQDANLEEISIRVNMSSSYLSRIIKEKSGQTFSAHLMDARMKRAAELLRDIGHRHYEIAFMVGYDNPKNFSRAFKQYFGVSPKEYRNNEG